MLHAYDVLLYVFLFVGMVQKKSNSDYSVITSAIRITAKTHTVFKKERSMAVGVGSCQMWLALVGQYQKSMGKRNTPSSVLGMS